MKPEQFVNVIGGGIGGSMAGWRRGDHGEALYRVTRGETMGSIATTWLGSWGRYPEIYAVQSAARRAMGGPTFIREGEDLAMPAAAIDKAVAAGVLARGTRATYEEKAGGGGVYTLPEEVITGYPEGTKGSVVYDEKHPAIPPLVVMPSVPPAVPSPAGAPSGASSYGWLALGVAAAAGAVYLGREKLGLVRRRRAAAAR